MCLQCVSVMLDAGWLRCWLLDHWLVCYVDVVLVRCVVLGVGIQGCNVARGGAISFSIAFKSYDVSNAFNSLTKDAIKYAVRKISYCKVKAKKNK